MVGGVCGAALEAAKHVDVGMGGEGAGKRGACKRVECPRHGVCYADATHRGRGAGGGVILRDQGEAVDGPVCRLFGEEGSLGGQGVVKSG